MTTRRDAATAAPRLKTREDWLVSSNKQNSSVFVYVYLVGSKAKRLVGNKRERRLRVATWNFSGMCSD